LFLFYIDKNKDEEPPEEEEVEFLGKAPKRKENRTTYLRK
jgi:hypothetical protein